MSERPGFVPVPTEDGGVLTAVVATRNGIVPIEINGVVHIGMLLSVNAASATVGIMTPLEAEQYAAQLIAAIRMARQERLSKGQACD